MSSDTPRTAAARKHYANWKAGVQLLGPQPNGWEWAEILERALAAKSAEVIALRQDAMRYRFVRADVDLASERWCRWRIERWTGAYWEELTKDGLDAAIDAALAGGEHG